MDEAVGHRISDEERDADIAHEAELHELTSRFRREHRKPAITPEADAVLRRLLGPADE